MNFFEKLSAAAHERRSLLCVGLDPRVKISAGAPIFETIVAETRRVIEATSSLAACYKPNSAFYEQHGAEGIRALAETIRLVPPEIPVLLDCKRGDIGSTAEAYARYAFDYLTADAVTVAPYMGRDAAEPFLAYDDKGLFVLGRTSNPSAQTFQGRLLEGRPLYRTVAAEALSWSDRVGIVVGGNTPEILAELRQAHPEAWILAPGIGAQGGAAPPAVAAGSRKDGLGLLLVAARAIAAAEDPAVAAEELRAASWSGVERARNPRAGSARPGADNSRAAAERPRPSAEESPAGGADPMDPVLQGILESESFKLGEFTLKSGKNSPFYIDLRRIPSFPELFSRALDRYEAIAGKLTFEAIAAIPTAGLPIGAALAARMGVPLIYPRIPPKPHGTGNQVEGAYAPGMRVLLLDDLVTRATSKVEAAGILREAGLEVEDLVVLIERGDARKELAEAGLRLHAVYHAEALIDAARVRGMIDGARAQELKAFIRE
ncbi:MAG: orotidine-5'-phosphate decarboxylase [Spirochaetaceae bacterium]